MADNNVRNEKYRQVELNELKKWFINLGAEISQEVEVSYQNLMYKIQSYENEYMGGKDIYMFSKEEILNMYESFGSSSVATLNVYTSMLRKYFDLAISEGHLKNKINQANNITYDDLVELVNKFKQDKKIVTMEFFYKLVEEGIKNYQDKAMLLLCYEGIMGKNYSELQNLKTDDIDLDNSIVKVIRNDKEISIPISNRLNNILYRALNEKFYKMHNGVVKKNEQGNTTGGADRELLTIEDTPYFLRPMKNRAVNLENKKEQGICLNNQAIAARITRMLRMYLDLSFVTPSSLFLSGVLHRLTELSENTDKSILSFTEVDKYISENEIGLNSFLTYKAYKDMLGE